jgi:hypothetical protein
MIVVGENAEFQSRLVAHGASEVISIFVEISPAGRKRSDQRNPHRTWRSVSVRNTGYRVGLRKTRERAGSV